MITVVIYTVFHSGVKTYRVTQKSLKLQEKLEEIVNIMVSDLQQCRYLLQASPTLISFWNFRGQKITYSFIDKGIYRNNISLNGDDFSVRHLRFEYFNKDVPIETFGEDLNKKQLEDITMVSFIISLTDGSQNMEISSGVNIR